MKSHCLTLAGAIVLAGLASQGSAAPATWLGADAFSMGAFLVDVKPGGPADAAGLKPGDFIYRYDNKGVSSMAGLFDLVHATPAGKVVEVYFLRGDRVMHADLKIAPQPADQEYEGVPPASLPYFDDPKQCTPEFRALAGRC